ncbi:TetR/AcrR family transcriptional regulator [Luteibacter sp. CQ10]|uniref:TetR/AcrR family transcriptional regulator n=1 Tax=Luteibacter sp. CQ10 TaxID=2805821 RepID=UPI0034A23EF9
MQGTTMNRAKPGKRSAAKTSIRLDTKQQPMQQRAQETFEAILGVTGRLLGEVGVERLSTNLICEKAGISPPALYRYFPNKYAILNELGERLMKHQNRAYREWLEQEKATPYDGSRDDSIRSLRDMQTAINAATRRFPGAIWIMRALRAVPTLRHIRLDSHDDVTETTYQGLRHRYPGADEAALRVAMRLSTEVMYSATEMAVDNPQIDENLINTEVAEMVVRYFDKFVEAEEMYKKKPKTGRRR